MSKVKNSAKIINIISDNDGDLTPKSDIIKPTMKSSKTLKKIPINKDNKNGDLFKDNNKEFEISTPLQSIKATKSVTPLDKKLAKIVVLVKEDTKNILTPQKPKGKFDRSLVTPVTDENAKIDINAELTLSATKQNVFGMKGQHLTSNLSINPRVEKIYKLVRKSTGTLGGNGYDGAIYGELTMHSMQRVINLMTEKCNMTSSSRFIDVGAGLGKPNFHAAQDPACRISIGVELEHIRWQLSMHNLLTVLTEMEDNSTILPFELVDEANKENIKKDVKLMSNTNFIVDDIDNASSTDPFTHIYMYDLGFPPDLQQSIAKKFNDSVHAEYLVSYRPPYRVLGEYGYEVELVDQITTKMHGSGENHMAYFYKRINKQSKIKKDSNTIVIPKRANFANEEDVTVVCDPAFEKAVKLAFGPLDNLKKYVKEVNIEHMNAERPKRDRKPRILF